MGEEKNQSRQRTDSWFKHLEDWFTKTIKGFAAFLFFLFGIGAVFGYWAMVSGHSWLVLVPFALGLLAYYSRDFAVIVLALVLLSFFFFPF